MDLNKILEHGRNARRAARRTLFGDRLKQALGLTKDANSWNIEEFDLDTHPIGDQHPGIAAVMYVREALANFDIPSQVNLKYTGMKRKSGSGAHRLKDGVVWIEGRFRSLSGAQHHIDVPVMVQDGHMVYPEIFQHQGRTRVMAQSAFDDIINNAESYRKVCDRKHVFCPPHDDPRPETPDVPTISTGMFGVTAAIEDIPGGQGPNLETPEQVGRTTNEYIAEVEALIDRAGPTRELVELLTAFQDMASKTAAVDNRCLDEAERDRSDCCRPGESITLANDITLKGRGGANYTVASGTKGTVIRDMLGNGDVYYVEFENGCKAPVNSGDINR